MINPNSIENLNDNQEDIKPDLNMARRFLTTLSQCDEAVEFTFQIFPEGNKNFPEAHAKVLHGSFENFERILAIENTKGCGIFVTINLTDGKGRRNENIIGIRAVFVDLDGAPLQPVMDAPLSPHIVIESSPNRYHAYWIIESLSCNEFTPIQKSLAARFRGDPQITDRSRVMRLPGFYHLKQAPYRSKIISESGQLPFTREAFLKAFEIQENASESNPKIISSDRVVESLQSYGMIIRKQEYPSGCWIIHCPWKHLHSKQDLGTKYFEPQNDYPCGGFKCFHAHCANKTLKDLLAYLGIKGSIVSEPLPLHRPLDAPKLFPFEALGNILMPAALALQRVIQAPDAICAQSVLGATSLACQPFANVFIDGREIPLSIYLITVAESGDRKSATDKFALKPIYLYQKMLADSGLTHLIFIDK